MSKKVLSLLFVFGLLMMSQIVFAEGELYIPQEVNLSEKESIDIDLDGDGILETFKLEKAAGSGGTLIVKIEDKRLDFYKGIYGTDHRGFWVAYPVYTEDDDINALYDHAERVYISKKDGEISVSEAELYEKAQTLMRNKSSKYYENPSLSILERKIERAARNRGIPSVILKSIAYAESNISQFRNGQPLISFDGGYGIMQVTPSSSQIADGVYDIERLKYDIDYNIEKGADILLGKWNYALASRPVIPRIDNNDPNILESWYFTIWAYNGWSRVNNPNDEFAWTKPYAYQDRVLGFAESKFGETITAIDPLELPKSGLPSASRNFDLPEIIHKGDLEDYVWGNQLLCREILNVRDKDNNWKVINSVPIDTVMYVVDGPYLQNGYDRYQVQFYKNGDLVKGWVAVNWGDLVDLDIGELGNYTALPFESELVDDSKEWNIKFNQQVNENYLSPNILIGKIKDNQFVSMVNTIPEIAQNGFEVKLTHKECFESGAKYAFVIKNGLQSKEGKTYLSNKYFEFVIE